MGRGGREGSVGNEKGLLVQGGEDVIEFDPSDAVFADDVADSMRRESLTVLSQEQLDQLAEECIERAIGGSETQEVRPTANEKLAYL